MEFLGTLGLSYDLRGRQLNPLMMPRISCETRIWCGLIAYPVLRNDEKISGYRKKQSHYPLRLLIRSKKGETNIECLLSARRGAPFSREGSLSSVGNLSL